MLFKSACVAGGVVIGRVCRLAMAVIYAWTRLDIGRVDGGGFRRQIDGLGPLVREAFFVVVGVEIAVVWWIWRCLAPVGQGTLRGCGATLLACGKGASGGRAPDFGVLGWRRRAKFSRAQAGLLPGARGTADGVF